MGSTHPSTLLAIYHQSKGYVWKRNLFFCSNLCSWLCFSTLYYIMHMHTIVHIYRNIPATCCGHHEGTQCIQNRSMTTCIVWKNQYIHIPPHFDIAIFSSLHARHPHFLFYLLSHWWSKVVLTVNSRSKTWIFIQLELNTYTCVHDSHLSTAADEPKHFRKSSLSLMLRISSLNVAYKSHSQITSTNSPH